MVQGVESAGQSHCVRQIVAPRSDTLSALAALHRHRHAGNPEVVCQAVCWIVSVLKAWRTASIQHPHRNTDTFGLWHASGYQKRSKLRCCNAAR
jgi:hypothetical protein